jgi:cephalosporin-C deacetylase-like acetyl esterase
MAIIPEWKRLRVQIPVGPLVDTMKEERVEFYNEKNQKIVGLLSLPDIKNPPIVIIIHGFVGAKEYYPFVNNSIRTFADAGFAVMRMDCRGSGESDLEFKDATIQSESEDVITTINFVKSLEFIDSSEIFLIGISVGCAAILVALKSNPKVKALVFWNPVTHFKGDPYIDSAKHRKTVDEEGVFYQKQALTGKEFMASARFFHEMMNLDVVQYYKFVHVQTLFIRGSGDRKERIKWDSQDVRMLNAKHEVIYHADHNFRDDYSQKKLIDITIDWLKSQHTSQNGR